MGMYTRLTFWAEITEEAATVILASRDSDSARQPWDSALWVHSYYHNTQGTRLEFDRISNTWMLNVDASCKNYNGQIEQFLTWVHPHVTSRDFFVGFSQYEEDDAPDLIWWTPDGFVMSNPPAIERL